MIQNAPEIMHPSALPFPLPKGIPVTPLFSPMSLSGNTYPLPPLPKTGKDDSGNPTCGHEKTPAWGTGAATRRREWGIACCMLLSGGRRNPSPFFKKIPNTIIAENNLPPCADSPHARNARSGSVPQKTIRPTLFGKPVSSYQVITYMIPIHEGSPILRLSGIPLGLVNASHPTDFRIRWMRTSEKTH